MGHIHFSRECIDTSPVPTEFNGRVVKGHQTAHKVTVDVELMEDLVENLVFLFINLMGTMVFLL